MLYDDCLTYGNPPEVAAFLGVSLHTLRRYRNHPDSMPEACKKLMRLRLEGDLRAIGGDAWTGFYLQQGELFVPFFERSFTPEQVKGMFFRVQQVAALEADLRDLRGRLWALQKVRMVTAKGESSFLPASPRFRRSV